MCRYLNNCLAYLVTDISISEVFAPAAPGTLMNRSSSGYLQISSEGARRGARSFVIGSCS